MGGRLEFVTSYEEVKKNIVQFNEGFGAKDRYFKPIKPV